MEPLNKQQLRALLKDRRAALPPDQKKQWDRQIVQRIAASPEFQRATALLLYAPLPGEIDLLPLARIARERGKPVAFPRCNTQTCTLEFYQLTPDARLIPGAYGIAEPPPNAPHLIPDGDTLCILPALSFDPCGNRLGYGKGYYDRFLADFPGIAAGAVYSSFLLKEIPTQPHDLPVSLLFTQRDRRVCGQSAASPAKPSHRDRLTAWIKAQVGKLHPSRAVTAAPATDAPKDPLTGRLSVSGLLRGALHKPPVLVAAVFILLLLSRLVEARLDRSSEYAGVVLLQILIFLLPAILYGKLRGDNFSKQIRMRLPR
ncbi:MAG: 5-formyltetrahydrofolate cyclo-ligase, partial [Clostridia bacterium]|nr:5-formyltetrahydrofolate cyclo-ligase [Clostridia bacterium]